MNIVLLTSEISVVLLAIFILVFDLFMPNKETRRGLGYMAACGIAGILFYSFTLYGTSAALINGFFVVDNFAIFFKQVFMVAALLTILFSTDYVERLTVNRGEFYALLLFALLGMMVMVSANDLITIFIGLELMTIVFYALVGFNLRCEKSSEAGIKYMILGSASSAVVLYGMSWIYGFTGSLMLSEIAARISASPAALLGLGLILAGFCFKLSIVPLHMWTPDVFEGAPTPITAMLAMGSKAAGFAILLRVFIASFGALQAYWVPIVTILAGLSMLVGIVVAMLQTNIKRMLAYSSIAQAGYILSGLLAVNTVGVKGMLFYIVLYMVASAGAFAVVAAVSNHSGSDDIADFAGLSQKSPLLALVMTVTLLTMAGLPPMGGFVGKFYIFMAITEQGYLWLAVLGFVMSMISVYYYILVAKTMYRDKAKHESKLIVRGSVKMVAVISLIATLFTGIYPGPLLQLANAAARILF